MDDRKKKEQELIGIFNQLTPPQQVGMLRIMRHMDAIQVLLGEKEATEEERDRMVQSLNEDGAFELAYLLLRKT